jgi:DNA repair exonuclease SbcCD ATPase subunit
MELIMNPRPLLVMGSLSLVVFIGSSAQQRRHNMAEFDTQGGKTIIKPYSNGVLDTVLVFDEKNSKKVSRRRAEGVRPFRPILSQRYQDDQTSQRNTSQKSHNDYDENAFNAFEEMIKRYGKTLERYQKQTEQYAKQVERYAQEVERQSKRLQELLDKHSQDIERHIKEAEQQVLMYQQNFKNFKQPPPPDIPLPPAPYPPEYQHDELKIDSLRQRMHRYFDELREVLRQHEWQSFRLDTTDRYPLNPQDYDRWINDFNRAYLQAQSALEHAMRSFERVRNMLEQLQPQLEEFKRNHDRKRRTPDER